MRKSFLSKPPPWRGGEKGRPAPEKFPAARPIQRERGEGAGA